MHKLVEIPALGLISSQIEYYFSSLRGIYTLQATQAKSEESEMNIYTT